MGLSPRLLRASGSRLPVERLACQAGDAEELLRLRFLLQTHKTRAAFAAPHSEFDLAPGERFCKTHPGTVLRPLARARQIRWHDCRHTTAALLLRSGCPLVVVQKMLRRRDPKLTAETCGHLEEGEFLLHEISKVRLVVDDAAQLHDSATRSGGTEQVLRLSAAQPSGIRARVTGFEPVAFGSGERMGTPAAVATAS